MIRKLYDKCITWAGYKYAKQFLAVESFIESSFFPIPPDVMIIPMVVSKKKQFIQIALIATIFSVLGALFGYYIGYSLNEIALKILEFYGYEYFETSEVLKEKFSSGSGWRAWIGILFTAGFTPLPFKLLTITSGIIHFNIISFFFICILTRGLRFFLVAYLAYRFGEKIGPFLDKQGAKWSIIITVTIILIASGIYFLFLK